MVQLKKSKKPAVRQGLKNEYRQEAFWCYLMLSIPIIGFLVLTVYPVLWTFKWSFFSYDGVKSHTVFIGLKNFTALFISDTTYWYTWLNTILFAVMKVPLEMIIAMLLALLLTKKLKGSGFFRTMFYMPNVISVVIIGLIFSNMFSYFGIVNAYMQKSGMINEGIDWFAKKNTAMAVLVIGSIWNTFGVNVMYFIASLANVPEELYECAQLDGASPAVKFFKITLPMIVPVAQIVLLLSIVGTLGINEYILVLTNGGPSGQTQTVMSYLTKQFVPGFAETSTPALGYGCAMSLITTIIFALVAIGYNQINKKISSIY